MQLSKALTLLSLAASAVAQETGVLKLDRALKRKLAKASKPSLKPRAKKLVETAHPILKEAFAATGKLTGTSPRRRRRGRSPSTAPRASGAEPPGRLRDRDHGSDCSAHSSTTFCYGMDGYVATDATNGLDDDWIMASPAPPSACASCGFFDDDDEHRAEFADRTDWADCVKCAEGDELMVFYEDCTGVCSPPAAKAYFEGFGFADLDASACIAHEPCGYEGYSLEGTVPPLETQLWSYSYEDDDPWTSPPPIQRPRAARSPRTAPPSRAVVGCWLDAGIPTDDDAAPIAYFEFLGETCAAAERSSEFRAIECGRLVTCEACASRGDCVYCAAESLCAPADDVPTPAFLAGHGKVSTCAADDFVATRAGRARREPDPYYGAAAWYLDLMNVEAAWASGVTGAGVRIRVNDDGVDASHPDLAKVSVADSCEVWAPLEEAGEDHGTAPPRRARSSEEVCGACDGDDWASGSLSDACEDAVVGWCTSDLDFDTDPEACLDFDEYFVTCGHGQLSRSEAAAFRRGVTEGRGGKGTVYASGDDVNFEGELQSRYTMSIAAVGRDGLHASYSSVGAPVFAAAPGGDGITSTT
ncbi:serine-type endopeptidase [Aureococcus anophagefferens]|nr:serine-type endopeptidase [Aureococcus anophagefferens]